jgi:nucleoside-diphosphate-sugar epimerase
MRILIYGSKGWIGNMLIKKWSELYPSHTIIQTEIRILPENIDKLKQEIKNTDRVFCCIGRTSGGGIPNIDYLEDHLNENVRDNLFAPMLLCKLCDSLGVHFSYIGTGCIFSTNTRNNSYIYTEEDSPDYFGSAYSVVKGYTDNLMKLFSLNALNLRIRMPVTDDWSPKNFITKISKFENICSYPNSMTYLPDLIPVMIDMSCKKITGTYNMVNGSMSHSQILDLYREIVDKNHTYKSIEEDTLNTMLKAKRSNNILANEKIIRSYKIRPLEDCILEALNNMKKLNEV